MINVKSQPLLQIFKQRKATQILNQPSTTVDQFQRAMIQELKMI